MEAAAEFAAKDEMKKANKKKQGEQSLNMNADAGGGNKKIPILKITKGKLGTKTKKKADDDDDMGADKNKMVSREIKGMEEMHWRIFFQLQDIEKAKDKIEKDP